jgi:hypothetical protein
LEVNVMTAILDRPQPQRDPFRRKAAAAAFAALAALTAAVMVAARQDMHSQAALHAFLTSHGPQLFFAWVFVVLAGFAWLILTVLLRRVLAAGVGRDLFVAAMVAGQGLTLTGASLAAAAAPPEARDIPLPVYNAFVEAGHLAGAAGSAATGLAFLALAAAVASAATPLLSRWWTVATRVAGGVLIVAAVAGPVRLPVTAAWLLVTGIVLTRSAKPVPFMASDLA